MESKKPLVICLFGPTASGKTDIAVALRQHLAVELVSVDSALVYREMDIGTAKPNADTLRQAPHRMIDICDPAETYSAARFREDALKQIQEIIASGSIPLLVGGTMLYFKVLLEGMSPLPQADPDVRDEIEAEAAEHGWAAMHVQLQQADPEAAARIHPNDPQRLCRALEVFRLTGMPMTQLQQQSEVPLSALYRVLNIALVPDNRAELHQRIAQRFGLMLEQGFVDEVRKLKKRGDLTPDLPSMRCVGYRQVWQYLEGQYAWQQMVDKGVAATRQLAKRQLTWLRSTPADLVFDPLRLPKAQMVGEITDKVRSFQV